MNSKALFSNHPTRFLLLSFLAWKSLLLLIAAIAPGPGYDTSTGLSGHHGTSDASGHHLLLEKLTRWDAIYFVKVADRGYVFEQEWAWGWGYTRAIAYGVAGIRLCGVFPSEELEALVGVVIAHVAHLLSVLLLFALGTTIFPRSSPRFALTAAFLHIFSPAGIFLSAPYAESPCALLSFCGILFFVKSIDSNGRPTIGQDLLVLLSGITFGIATTFRSNGILNGLLLLEEAVRLSVSVVNGFQLITIRRLLATGLGGLSVGAGFVVPQYIAWVEYCGHGNVDANPRPWCHNTLPSVYSFVQEHYWNVGFLRYYTISNLPLFFLAAPMMSVMIISGIWALQEASMKSDQTSEYVKGTWQVKSQPESRGIQVLRNLAVAQLLLAFVTLTSAHVQIITRISSASPVWLWYLSAVASGRDTRWAGNFIVFMVIYAVIQGGLFASFMPPA